MYAEYYLNVAIPVPNPSVVPEHTLIQLFHLLMREFAAGKFQSMEVRLSPVTRNHEELENNYVWYVIEVTGIEVRN